MIKIKLENKFKLYDTVTCGQIFRFYELDDNSFDIILSDRVINIYQKNNYLYVTSNKEDNLKEVVINYFDLENDYEKMNDYLIKKDDKLKDAISFSSGLTMIRQQPFETIFEYIISANNGVPQITNSLNLVSEKYGRKVNFNDKEYFLFPSSEDLKDVTESDLRNCKVGFRDKYLKKIIDKVNKGEFDINSIFEMDTQTALNKLMENNGIGPKVASCILLFAYQKYDVFPIDTWVKKIMKNNYEIEGEKNIRKFAKETYGKYSGIAIQYLFNYSRNS